METESVIATSEKKVNRPSHLSSRRIVRRPATTSKTAPDLPRTKHATTTGSTAAATWDEAQARGHLAHRHVARETHLRNRLNYLGAVVATKKMRPRCSGMAVAISFLVGAGLVSLALAATPGASTWHVMKAARPLVDTTQLLWDNMKQFPSAAPTGMAA